MAYTNTSSGFLPLSGTSTDIPLGFTATAGRELLVYAASSAFVTAGSGWTKHLTTSTTIELACFRKTAAGGETTCPVTQGVARSIAYTAFEFPSGVTVSAGLATGDTTLSFQSITGMTSGQDNSLIWVFAQQSTAATAAASVTWAGTPTPVEMSEVIGQSQTGTEDGIFLSSAITNTTGTTGDASFTYATGPSGLSAAKWKMIIGVYGAAGGGNATPTANAGADQNVAVNTPVTLNGSGSTDSDGTISTYTWTQVSGTAVTLSGSGSTRTFTPTTTGTRVFGLTVTDNGGATSAQDTVTVNVGATGNQTPTANAGPDQTVQTGTPVTLTGSGSDSDGTISTYTWTQVSGPTASLSGSGANRTFTPAADGSYVFGLTVTDNGGATSAQDTVTITSQAAPVVNSIAVENAKTTGVQPPSQWFQGLSSLQLPSFPRSTYYLPGQIAQFSVNYANPFTIQIWRLGHYGGNGAREVSAPTAATPVAQPTATVIANSNGAVTCSAWSVNATWTVPLDAEPGWYMATFRNNAGDQHGHSLFLVSDKNNKKSTLIVTGDATWHAAYNGYGGNNVYGAALGIGSAADRALCSTYDKPVHTIDYVPQTHFYNNTYPYLKWSESVGVNAGVTTIEQIKDDPTILEGRTLIVWTGHNEYIPQTVMTKTKAILAAGGTNMVNIAGNDFFWRVKYTDGAFSSATTGRVMWCKKDTMDGPTAIRTGGAGTPFTTAADWTGTWQDTRWSLREPSYQFFGDQFIANGVRSDAVTVPSTMKAAPPWRNCAGVQALSIGQSYTFAAGTLGMEWDEPHASTTLEYMKFAQTDVVLSGSAADANGQTYTNTATGHHAFMAMVSGNAYVVNFNSDQWGWALDSLHLRGNTASDINARQMMLNVLYDLGAAGNNTNIQATGLTVPVAVSDFGTSYGLTSITPPPPVVPGGAYISVTDTPTLNLTITGDGSQNNPYILSGVASPELGYSQSTQMFYSDGVNWHEL